MKIKYKNNIGKVYVSKDIIPDDAKKIVVHIGAFKKEISVEIDNELEGLILLPSYIFEHFKLPEKLDYEVMYKDNTLHIGPVIAFIPLYHSSSYTKKVLNNYIPYLNSMKYTKGVIFITSNDLANISNKTMKGCYYNGEKFIYHTFPYPDSVYRKTSISIELYNDLLDKINNKLFNNYFFNKLDMHEAIKDDKEILNFIPETKKLEDISNLNYMLDKHTSVYLKKIDGYKAKGIIKVQKNKKDNTYKFIYRLKPNENLNNNEVMEFIKKNSDYIVQQGVNVKRYDNRMYDFRVIFQKNRYGNFIIQGIIGKFSKKDSIATNFLLDGFSLTFEDSMKKIFNMTDKEIFIKEEEIKNNCTLLCKRLEKVYGNYGDLGIDVMIDKDKKVWILEVNKLHDHKFPLYSIEDETMYYRVITTPFKYAKFLGGFYETV